ncbi:MAG: TonB-dependent receptor [Sphingobacteriia bacterium]|nr:TonB-dependent receptor [Sphingobacteriia bacterium]
MKKRFFSGVLLLACLNQAQAQKARDTMLAKPGSLNEVVVYANKFAEKFKRVAQTVDVLKAREQLNYQTNTADVLINSGKLFVQKSQQGGGSPVIRGFEASRILMMVDGVRMNNAIYRAGHLQNIISIDNMVLDRVEVLYGPSSTIYGSDALGGVVNMYTKNPVLSDNGKTMLSGSSTLRYSSAISENRGNLQLNIGGKKWASFTSVTYGSFGDMKQGKNRPDAYPSFGKKDFIVQRSGNTDIVVPNPDPDNQTPSGYKQVDVTQKFLFKPGAHVEHLFNLQFSNTNDIPRYDRLTEKTTANVPVYAEWYYGPQLRNMAAYQFKATEQEGFFQAVQLTASYQDLEESRISRRFQSNNKDSRWERVNVFGVNFDAKHYSGKNELHIGAESYSNFVRSTAERMNIVSGARSRITTRYADGPTTQSSHAVYAQHTYKINDHWTLNDGLRFSLVKMDARFIDTALTHFPFTRAKQHNKAVTGNLGIVYASRQDLRVAFVLSSGFRAPNVDDLSKVFDSQTGMVVVPNTSLKPEYTYNAELSLNKYGQPFTYGASLFYTRFQNALVLDKAQFNGQDSIYYSGVKSRVYSLQNKATANLFGFSVNAAYTFAKGTSVDGVVTYTKGTFNDDLNGKVPLDHVPPVYGRVSLKHVAAKWNAECYALFNGWKKLSAYNPNGEDNLQYATPDGMPSWVTLNLRAGASFNQHLSLQVMLENLTDRNYRYFASGVSAPGRNLSVSLRASF